MSDSILDEENNYNDEIAESISKSCESNSKKRSNTILGSKKKIRRSRIIISDTNEMINESKKEIYDSETKLKKSIYSAVCFNENLNANRKEISKDFLKRKIKAAFEREPIDKNKGFFNVPFIPMPSMFSTLPSTASLPSIPPQQSNRQVNAASTGQSYNQNISSKSTSINTNTTTNPNFNTTTSNISKQDQSVVINLNKSNQDAAFNPSQSTNNINRNPPNSSANNYDNFPKSFPSNQIQSNSIIHGASQSKSINQNLNYNSQIKLPSQNSRHLFNVNQSNVSLNVGENFKNNEMTKQYMMNPSGNAGHVTSNSFNINLSEEKEIKYQINASSANNAINMNINPDVKNSNEPGKMSMQQSGVNLFNLSPEEIKRLKPEQIEQLNRAIRQKAQMQKQNINNNINVNPNKNSNLGELIRQQQNSIYVQIIESYKNDPEKFRSEATTTELIKLQKLISMSRMQSDNNNISQNAVSNIAPKEGINNSYQFNLQLLQSIQKQIQRARELNQNQNQNSAVTNTGNNNNVNIQTSKPN